MWTKQLTRQPKIAYLDIGARRHQNVSGLQVSVHYLSRMQVRKTAQQLREYSSNVGHRPACHLKEAAPNLATVRSIRSAMFLALLDRVGLRPEARTFVARSRPKSHLKWSITSQSSLKLCSVPALGCSTVSSPTTQGWLHCRKIDSSRSVRSASSAVAKTSLTRFSATFEPSCRSMAMA
eukprot:SAG31_NODE_636_length_13344_cov_8.492451_15_plen_179_part_00